MTDPDLAQLESAATSAPWREDPTGWDQEGADRFILILGGGVPDSASEYCCAGISDYGQGPDQVEADAALIVAAVKALPRLLEIERAASEWMDADWAELQGLSSPPGAADLNLLGLRVTSAKRAMTASLYPQEPTP